jgi:hypothetical protein
VNDDKILLTQKVKEMNDQLAAAAAAATTTAQQQRLVGLTILF